MSAKRYAMVFFPTRGYNSYLYIQRIEWNARRATTKDFNLRDPFLSSRRCTIFDSKSRIVIRKRRDDDRRRRRLQFCSLCEEYQCFFSFLFLVFRSPLPPPLPFNFARRRNCRVFARAIIYSIWNSSTFVELFLFHVGIRVCRYILLCARYTQRWHSTLRIMIGLRRDEEGGRRCVGIFSPYKNMTIDGWRCGESSPFTRVFFVCKKKKKQKDAKNRQNNRLTMITISNERGRPYRWHFLNIASNFNPFFPFFLFL